MSFSIFQLFRAGSLRLWCILILLSAAISGLFIAIQLPGALLLGPMLAGIFMSIQGARLQVHRRYFLLAQGVIGAMVAESVSGGIFTTFAQHWLLFTTIVCITMIACTTMGWVISRYKVLPGTTAIWGSSPGAAAAMVLMAEEFGADARLVAFMQYLRVIVVASAASFIARLWVDTSALSSTSIVWFPHLSIHFITTVAFILAALGLSKLLHIPSGAMLVPMLLGTLLQTNGWLALELPEWLLSMAYAIMGWRIGLGFTQQVLKHALKALPQISLSIVILISFCCGLAYLLTQLFHLDPLTAYLATSPGGMDSIAIIAASSPNVDLQFVMSLQTVRLFLVIFLGPIIARFIAARLKTQDAPKI